MMREHYLMNLMLKGICIMTQPSPKTTLDARYSDSAAVAASWEEAVQILKAAPIYWLSTVRPDGRPHVTPLIAVWDGDAMVICTGAEERKYRNLEANDACVITTGESNAYVRGFDVIVEGHAQRVSDDVDLRNLAALYLEKYGSDWQFDVQDGAFEHGGHRALVFRIAPEVAFGFHRGARAAQTRWVFGS